MKRLIYLIPLLLALPANGQSLWRNFFTTNRNPIVEVVAGSNATVQASTVGVNLRRFIVNAVPSSSGFASNVYGTNVIGAVAEATHATNADFATYSTNSGYATNAGFATNASYATNAGTATNNLLKAGDTASGPILTTSSTTNSPSANELATAGWIRSLFDGFGVSYYATTNINNTFTNSDVATAYTNFYEFSTNIPSYWTRSYVGVTNGGYFGFVVITNTFLQINSGITVNSYFSSANGTGTTGPQVKPEIYISYDKTNWFGDWDAQPQFVPEGSTNLQSWVIANPTYISTNAAGFYIQRRYKMVTQTTPAASDLTFHLGTNYTSHIALSGSSSSSGNAYLAANQTFTGSNHFTIPLVSSLASNTPSANQVLTATSATTAAWKDPYYSTNQGALTIAMSGRETWLAFATNADFAIADLSGVDTTGTNVQKFTIIVTNTAGPTTKLMTVPASWIKHDGVNCYITNQGILTGVVYPGMGTNAAFKCLK